jgi:SAM-dependent methyltransferase
MLAGTEGSRFFEIGCGEGEISAMLLERGYTGVGVDFSSEAIERASKNLSHYIEKGKYRLLKEDFSEKTGLEKDFDLAISLMVMEHVHDDLGFLKRMRSHVRPGGHVIICVPTRNDRWSFEDDTVGHLRRYEKKDLHAMFEQSGFSEIEIWSIAVPVANMLLGLSNLALKRSGEGSKMELPKEEQTKTSGVRDVPFKTVYPAFFRILLNPVTLWPLFVLQRLFYGSGLGLTMLVKARRD